VSNCSAGNREAVGESYLQARELLEEETMPQSTHNRGAELHSLAMHAHEAAAVAHEKGDHLSAHEHSKQALEYSKQAYEHSASLAAAAGNPVKE